MTNEEFELRSKISQEIYKVIDILEEQSWFPKHEESSEDDCFVCVNILGPLDEAAWVGSEWDDE